MEKFTKKITFLPAFDKRDPDPKKDYGIGSVELRFILKGEKGAVHFNLLTGWHLPHIDYIGRTEPLPADLGYHSYIPVYEGQGRHDMKCNVLKDSKEGYCYYGGSGLAADRIYNILLKEGSKGVWRALKKYYHSVFDGMDIAKINGAKRQI